MKLTDLAIIAASLAAATTARAEEIQWAQVTNLPKGLNLPKDVSADILGIELGEAYASAKAKLERLHRDSPAAANNKKVEQTDRRISMVLPGTSLSATYPGYIDLTSKVPGAGRMPIEERLTVFFSAPASSQQVIGIERSIAYTEHGDQPRVSELLDRLKAKFKGEPLANPSHASVEYTFVFDNGRAVDPKTLSTTTCLHDHGIQRTVPSNSEQVARMNSEGRCDIVLRVAIGYGLSKDHIARVTFSFSDGERTKANFTTDNAFFGNYVKQLQDKTKGTGPKL